MPRYIIKPVDSEDFYFTYSTVIDGVVEFGSRDEYTEEDRLARADKNGSSALWGTPAYMGWERETIYIREGLNPLLYPEERVIWLEVPREKMKEFCETYDGKYFNPDLSYCEWYYPEDE